jgi:hypothetical protein
LININSINQTIKKGVAIMPYQAPGKCPICGQELLVSRLSCRQCGTNLDGEFKTCKFCQLPAEQVEFVEIFLKCRGNIKEVEKELGISYPTVRSRLEGVIQALGFRSERIDAREAPGEIRMDILEALEKGEIGSQAALEQLKKLKK